MAYNGDDIDRMLEGQYSGGPPAGYGGPPPRKQSRERDRRRRSRSRDRERSRRRERDRGRRTDDMRGSRNERLDRERERDQRTVFAAQIHPKNEEREIFDFFSEVGKVVDIQLIRDTRTYKSKGLAYIEFEDRRSVPHALALSGRNLNGYPVLVQMTQSDRGYVPPAAPAVPIAVDTKPKTLRVTNLNKKLGEDDLTPIFSAFGDLRGVELIEGAETNEAYFEFKRGSDAIAAMQQLNGFEVVGRKLSVTQANEERKHNMRPTGDGRAGRFEDAIESGNGGVVMSLQDKQSLMKNLAQRAGLSMPASHNPNAPVHQPPPQQSQSRGVTRCLLLQNMFDPATETDPDFDLEIREDVREEVSSHGQLLHIYVDKQSKDGKIYLKFADTMTSEKAYQHLNGRWFSQNKIEGSFIQEQQYASLFPETARM